MIDALGRFGAVFNDWLNKLRTTNAKALATIALYIGTYLVWAACTLMKIPIQMEAFTLWLVFCAALGGFSLSQFKTERTTDYGYLDKVKPNPSTVVNSAETKVTGAPVTVEDKG